MSCDVLQGALLRLVRLCAVLAVAGVFISRLGAVHSRRVAFLGLVDNFLEREITSLFAVLEQAARHKARGLVDGTIENEYSCIGLFYFCIVLQKFITYIACKIPVCVPSVNFQKSYSYVDGD